MPSAIVKEMEVTGVPCLVVISTRPLAENEEITLDLGYQLEVREGIKNIIGPLLDTQNMFYTWSHPPMLPLQKLLL